MSTPLRKILNAFKHVGTGGNVGLRTLARNALPAYVSSTGWAFSPLTIYLSINSVCNLRCKMCDVGQRNRESSFYRNLKTDSAGAELSLERLRTLMAEAASFPVKPRISVTTTEPLLYADLFELARCVRSGGMEFQFTTNGLLLGKRMEEMLAADVSEICVSLDGKGELHDHIRGLAGLYDGVVASLCELRDRKAAAGRSTPAVTIAVTISNHNFDRLAELADDLPEDLYDRMIVSHMNFIDQSMADEFNCRFTGLAHADTAGLPAGTTPDQVDVAVLHDQLARIKAAHPKVHFAPDYARKDLETFYRRPDQFVWPSRCLIPWFVMEVLANGEVIPLTRCIHLPMGNVNENTLLEIWNGPRYRELRRTLMRHKNFPICRRCRGIL